jgi:hypothetical protein
MLKKPELKFLQPRRVRDFLYYRLKPMFSRLKKRWPSSKTRRLKLYYFGFKYKCPLCQSTLRRFIPYGMTLAVLEEKQVVGGGVRQNGWCPVCHSTDRERLVTLWLQNESGLFGRSLKLLHVAPEAGLQSILQKQKNIDYLTADLFSDSVMVKMDIMDIQYPNNYFDAIICNHVLEHVISDKKALLELFRVLKPTGWAILQVPISLTLQKTYEDPSINTPIERARCYGQDDHLRLFARDYAQKLLEAGFKLDIFDWTTKLGLFGGKTNKFGLNEKEKLYVVRKP